MMAGLIRRAEEVARSLQRRKLEAVAARLKALLGGVLIEIEEGRVLVRGRGIVKRWVIDPALRFLAGGLK